MPLPERFWIICIFLFLPDLFELQEVRPVPEAEEHAIEKNESIRWQKGGRSCIEVLYKRNGHLILEEATVRTGDRIDQQSFIVFNAIGERRYSWSVQTGNQAWNHKLNLSHTRKHKGTTTNVARMIDFQNDGAPDLIVVDADSKTRNYFVLVNGVTLRPLSADLFRLAREKGTRGLLAYLVENPELQPNAKATER